MLKQKQRMRLVGVLALASLAASNAVAAAADKQAPKPAPAESAVAAPEPAVGARADRLLRDMGDYLKAAKEFSVHAEVLYDDILASGQKIQLAAADDIMVRRPDRFYIQYRTDVGRKRAWYDGKTFTLLDEAHGTYATEQTPPGIDATLDHLIEQLGFTPPLSDLLYSDPYAVLKQYAAFGFYVGLSEVEGVPCHHLAFVGKNVDWQIWIDDGKLPLPRKVVITYKTLSGAPQFMAVLSDWDFATRLPDSLFSAALPPRVEQIGFLKAATSGKKEQLKKSP